MPYFLSIAKCSSPGKARTKLIQLLLLSLPCMPAMATSTDDASGLRVFPLSWFEASQPRTALDLVSRLPGFAMDGGDNGVRGYAGSAGNVLIDGKRPVSKYGQLANALKRIPADAVDHVELIRGSAPGIDMQGQPVVANVIRRAGASTNVRALVAARLYGEGELRPEARIEGLRSTPDYVMEGTLHAYDVGKDSGDGYRRRFDASGNLLRDSATRLDGDTQGYSASAGLERALGRGDLRLTGTIGGSRSRSDERVTEIYPAAETVMFTNLGDYSNAEFGVQYGHDVGSASRAEYLFLQQLRDFDTVETETSAADVARFSEEGNAGESILRTTVRTSLDRSRSFEWGGEAAFNFLGSDAVATENGVPVELPAASVDVEETRGEVFSRYSWSPSRTVTAELGAALEGSRIRQTGDASTSKSLSYFKPRGLLAWQPARGDQVRLTLQRNVGQLDFDDFVSSAELSTGTVNVGNSDLEPSTSWDLLASWERQMSSDATVIVSLLHSEISDVVDIAPLYADTDGDGITETYQGVGNIGDGSQSEIALDLNLPLDRLGIPGGLLQSSVAYVVSSVTDPVTGEDRRIGGVEYPWDGSIAFTQDLPERRMRWGVSLPFGDSEPQYRVTEVRTEEKDLRMDMFAEYFPSPDWALGFSFQNLAKRERTLTRELYDAPRNTGSVDAIVVEHLRTEPHIRLYAQRDFR